MNVWTNTSVRRSNGGEVQLGFGFPHSLIAVLQEEAWLQQLSTINCHPATLQPLPLTAADNFLSWSANSLVLSEL